MQGGLLVRIFATAGTSGLLYMGGRYFKSSSSHTGRESSSDILEESTMDLHILEESPTNLDAVSRTDLAVASDLDAVSPTDLAVASDLDAVSPTDLAVASPTDSLSPIYGLFLGVAGACGLFYLIRRHYYSSAADPSPPTDLHEPEAPQTTDLHESEAPQTTDLHEEDLPEESQRDPNSSLGPPSYRHLAPIFHRTEGSTSVTVERFTDYLARQMGFKDKNDCAWWMELAYKYVKQDLKKDEIHEQIYEYLENLEELRAPEDVDSLFADLIEELERCILGYFAFHWPHAERMKIQVLEGDSEPEPKILAVFLAGSREVRFKKKIEDLKLTRMLSTMVEQMRVLGYLSNKKLNKTHVMKALDRGERSPVLLLMGGGMGAGKSTIIKAIMEESFWSSVVPTRIEADFFKEMDPLYREVTEHGNPVDHLPVSREVHENSTKTASKTLVIALNEGHDIIMDGTLAWEPFVTQMIDMARDVHNHSYALGPWYDAEEGTTKEELYFVRTSDQGGWKPKRPYRIELVGVVCDPYLAVVRGIRRAIGTRRGVGVQQQLNSHKRFAAYFASYCKVVDHARLYCTTAPGGPPKLIACKDGESNLLMDQHVKEYLEKLSKLNEKAESVYELYTDINSSIWKDVVLFPMRRDIQERLKAAITEIERHLAA